MVLTLFHRFKNILERADFVLVIHPRCPDFEIDSIGERKCTMLSTIVPLINPRQLCGTCLRVDKLTLYVKTNVVASSVILRKVLAELARLLISAASPLGTIVKWS